MSDREKLAWEMARTVHKDQKRRSGQPYMYHIEKVVEVLRALSVTDEDTIITAILHDVLEECDAYADEIRRVFGEDILLNVEVLTHTKEWDYDGYIIGIVEAKNRPIILVKMADMLQNITDAPTRKQKIKYMTAFPKLLSGL